MEVKAAPLGFKNASTGPRSRIRSRHISLRAEPLRHYFFAVSPDPILSLDLPGITKVKSGKVREVFDLGDSLLFVATDRQISHFWFDQTESWLPNHRLLKTEDPLPDRLKPFASILDGRSMIVRKTQPLPIECVVRGYLSGSGWKEYRNSGSVCGIALPPGLVESSELPEPIFTPATKAESGHDENISFEQAVQLTGPAVAQQARDLSLRLYRFDRDYARTRGIIIVDGQLILIDEVLTPDSSRFWPAEHYAAGRGQPSFDKQFVRDHLETLDWDKTPPAPALPADIVAKTQAKYLEAYRLLTGKPL
jgi:phosphoribosylaminoimidazole-succinocarboxamide synthase